MLAFVSEVLIASLLSSMLDLPVYRDSVTYDPIHNHF